MNAGPRAKYGIDGHNCTQKKKVPFCFKTTLTLVTRHSLRGKRLLADVHCLQHATSLELRQHKGTVKVTWLTEHIRFDASDVMWLGRVQRHHEAIKRTL